MEREKVTLKRIAEETGFSVNSVSRALKDMPDISKETRDLIKAKAEELGYIGNMLASSMRSGLTNTIAVILSDIVNPHFAIIVKDIVESLRQYNYTAFVMTTDEDSDLECQAIKAAIGRNVDGIIICPTQQSEDNVYFLKQSGIPFVLIGRYFRDVDTNYVICNDRMGGYQAAKYLINLGHRDILFLNAEPYISSSQDRQAGYEAALQELEIPLRKEFICNVPVLGSFDTYFEKIFSEYVSFTAIIAFSDMLAWELMSYLKASGYSVPADMSVIAFDDLQSRYVLPFQLTSVTAYKGKMARTAVEILIKKIMKHDESTEKVVLTTRVVQRNSCAAPRKRN